MRISDWSSDVCSSDLDRELSALLAEAEHAIDPHRIAELHERLAAIGADSAPARPARILAGLGFDEAAQQRPCAAFPGGWRMRVALPSLLFQAPHPQPLDHPTHHPHPTHALCPAGSMTPSPAP